MGNNQELDPVKYYDNISSKYDTTLNSNSDNSKIRDEVKHYFLKNVSGKIVLDFGGGTGKDLIWLAGNRFKIYFCEPSKGMREIALKNIQNLDSPTELISMDELSSDFHNWNKNNIPIDNKLDGILANFAVLNSIKDLEELSEKLALISNKNCRLIVSVLNVNFKRILSHDLSIILRLFLSGNGFATQIKDGNNKMIVYLHTESNIIKALGKYFNYVESFRIQKSTFRLFHFMRNQKKVV
jgi:SAM-dependent methyltransferase